jgi:general secretion pathway protein J
MRKTDTKGFTLLEVLIAMFILAVVLSTIFTSYTGTFRIIEEVEAQAEVYAMARVALTRMQEDLESIYFREARKSETAEDSSNPIVFVGDNQKIEERDADRLRFFSRAHLRLGQEEAKPELTEISYYVTQPDEEGALVLYRSDTPELTDPPAEGTGGLVMCDGLFGFNITFYDGEEDSYENWDSSDEEFEEALPKRVSILLQFVNEMNPEAPHKFMTSFALPMAKDD